MKTGSVCRSRATRGSWDRMATPAFLSPRPWPSPHQSLSVRDMISDLQIAPAPPPEAISPAVPERVSFDERFGCMAGEGAGTRLRGPAEDDDHRAHVSCRCGCCHVPAGWTLRSSVLLEGLCIHPISVPAAVDHVRPLRSRHGTVCPACQSAAIAPTAWNRDENAYWRRSGCGEIWNAARRAACSGGARWR